MNDQFELTLVNQRSEVARLLDRLEAFARQHGLAPRVLHDVQLALEEHLTNILVHGYDDEGEHSIRVHVQLNAADLRIEVADDGRPFNPLEQPAPDLTKPIAERPVGGLGIHMMQKSLNGTTYRRADGKNILVMMKLI